ncbi:hypothetical protein FIBSPDRAFT_850525 [Athelia psychrophila]|uniref:Uncharacterized protein n=1 Tax=Athelia psychrophila TaxID=1759441 RepID=A0A166TIJ6_9AGAM|nr:hypothetical protein FIBSPDRAFT_850525 [Fibularhizoctonia sp. CBS 109695]
MLASWYVPPPRPSYWHVGVLIQCVNIPAARGKWEWRLEGCGSEEWHMDITRTFDIMQ